MRVLLDAAHAADVWTFAALEDRLLGEGHETLWVSRPHKQHVTELIEARGRPHAAGPAAGAGRLGLARELVLRDWRVWQTVREFRPDAILTRSPAGVHAGRLTRTPVLYDTDHGPAAGLLYWAAAPFAHATTGPEALASADSRNGVLHSLRSRRPRRSGRPSRSERRHRSYRGFKELLYLHPSRFQPDPGIRAEIGCEPGERLFLLRLSALAATHDRRVRGLSGPLLETVAERLRARGRLVVSAEAEPPAGLAELAVPVAPQRFHHLLAACDLVVGDSVTVAAEAAVLGVAALHLSSWTQRHPLLCELGERWQLTACFQPHDAPGLLAALDDALGDLDGLAARQRDRRAAMLEWADGPDDLMAHWLGFVQRRGIGYDAVR